MVMILQLCRLYPVLVAIYSYTSDPSVCVGVTKMLVFNCLRHPYVFRNLYVCQM